MYLTSTETFLTFPMNIHMEADFQFRRIPDQLTLSKRIDAYLHEVFELVHTMLDFYDVREKEGVHIRTFYMHAVTFGWVQAGYPLVQKAVEKRWKEIPMYDPEKNSAVLTEKEVVKEMDKLDRSCIQLHTNILRSHGVLQNVRRSMYLERVSEDWLIPVYKPDQD